MKRNQFVSLVGLETLLIGIFLKTQINHITQDDRSNHMIHAVVIMDEQPFTTIMILIGLFSFAVGLISTAEHWVMTLYLSLLSGIWLAYATSFFLLDCHFDRPISLNTLLTLCMAVQIMAESYFSALNDRKIRLNIVLKKKPPKNNKDEGG